MAQILIELFKKYEITDNFGYFILNNAFSNDTCVEITLSEFTNLTFPERQARRLRCWGHILNLGAQSLLYGDDPEAFEVEINVVEVLKREKQKLEL